MSSIRPPAAFRRESGWPARKTVDEAVASALKAFPAWSEQSSLRRSRVMFKFKELLDRHHNELAEIISREHGKVFSDAKGEVTRGIEIVEYACGAPNLLKNRVQRQHRRRHRQLELASASGCLRRSHAVQLSGDGAAVDDSDRAGHR